MKTEALEVNGVSYPVKIALENRDNSSVRVGKNGVIIKLPSTLNREELFREILRIKMWAKQKILENKDKFTPKPARIYADKDILNVGGHEYILLISFKEKASSSARISGNTISLVISSNLSEDAKNKHISSLLSRCIASKRIGELKAKLHELNTTHFNQEIKKIFFKHNKSNWGSCSEQGNINISTRLLFAPIDVLEYVCIHELAHLLEHNHSDTFWAHVEKAMPNYEEKKQWLKDNGDGCVF